MKKIFIILFVSSFLFSCKKEATCDTWLVTYWQGKADHTTVTTNYYPYDKDEKICGSGKDTVAKNNFYILSQAGPDLYNYKTFVAKR